MGHVFHRDPRTQLPVAVAGDGVHIIDSKGKRYLDASGGAAVSALGHSDPEVRAAIKAQVDRIAYAHTAFSRPRRPRAWRRCCAGGRPRGSTA